MVLERKRQEVLAMLRHRWTVEAGARVAAVSALIKNQEEVVVGSEVALAMAAVVALASLGSSAKAKHARACAKAMVL